MKQLLLSLIFALVALTGLQAQTIWDGTADTSWYNETSTKFEISTAEQLAGLAKLVNNGNDFSGKTILLTADIVLNDTSDWENWESSAPANTWTPIGNWPNLFSGTFDGQGHTVSGIYNNSENYYQGLFGYNRGIIKNIGVRESYIKGDSSVGGVCGFNSSGTISNCYNTGNVNGTGESNSNVGGMCGGNSSGTISNCYNSGNVNGTGESAKVGGICGYNYSSGTISNCYNTGNVNGTGESNSNVGGVCGDNNGTISDCYNTGNVNGNNRVGGVCGQNSYNGFGSISNCYNTGNVNGTGNYVGGVCGDNYYGTISNCYYLESSAEGGITGEDISGQAEVKTAEQFASGEVCWLLNGSSDANPTWFQTLGTDNSPVLDNTHGTVYATTMCSNDNITCDNQGPSKIGVHTDNDNDGFCDFCGKINTQYPAQSDGIYQISNCAELYWFAGLVNGTLDGVGQNTAADAVLVADIIINKNVPNADGSLTSNTESLLAWTPIGQNYNNPFRGSFDGQGHTVSGIYINSEKSCQGLFGSNGGTIKNVGVTKSYITGGSQVGGVCGDNYYGTISNCYNTGNVNGNDYVGGVCGDNYYGTISNCYNTGNVNGNDYVGGVCGDNSYAISGCYNSGNVSGTGNYVGGVCGDNYYGTISNCYNTGNVNGNNRVGGVCGQNSYNGTISGCYNTGNVNGNDRVGGVCGSNGGTISDCCHLQGSATGGINGSNLIGQAEVKTAEQFASGEVCWLLNGSSDANPTWFQTLGTNNTPVLDNTYGTVYATGRCPNDGNNTYSNQGPSRTGEHSDSDNDGFCDFCGKIMPQEPAQSDGIYQISNCAELYWFAGFVNGTLDGVGQNTAADAVLVADIIINKNVPNADGSLTANTENMLVWTPIGSDRNNEFRGSFDGQGHTVSGIYINSEKSCQGLFGSNDGTIKNVGVTKSYITGGSQVGGVCGQNGQNGFGSISNCYNTGNVSGNDYVGGVCGDNSYGTISNCYNTGNVNGNNRVGGVCGQNGQNGIGSTSNCYNTGNVNGNDYVGGVCGQNSYGTISNCYYLESSAEGGIDGEDISNRAKVKTAEQFASGAVCWLLNEEQSEGAWGQKLGTDPCPVLGGPAVFKNGATYYNEEGSAIVETNSEQASFVIVPENLTIKIYGSDGEATVYNLAGIIIYQGSERIIPVPNPGIYMVRIGNEVQKTIVR